MTFWPVKTTSPGEIFVFKFYQRLYRSSEWYLPLLYLPIAATLSFFLASIFVLLFICLFLDRYKLQLQGIFFIFIVYPTLIITILLEPIIFFLFFTSLYCYYLGLVVPVLAATTILKQIFIKIGTNKNFWAGITAIMLLIVRLNFILKFISTVIGYLFQIYFKTTLWIKVCLSKNLLLCSVAATFTVYYIFYFSWFKFFERTALLRKLYPWGHLGGFAPSNTIRFGISRSFETAQYDASNLSRVFGWFQNQSMISLRWPFVYDIENTTSLLSTQFEIIFIILAFLIILSKIIGFNKFRAGIGWTVVFIFFIKLLALLQFETNTVFHEIFNGIYAVGTWEASGSTALLFVAILLYKSLLQNSTVTKSSLFLIFWFLFLYILVTIASTNSFIALYFNLEFQFILSFGLLALFLPAPEIKKSLFSYLVINVLASLVFLFGIIFLYRGVGSFQFNDGFLTVHSLGVAIPVGLFFKLISLPTLILFQKIYSKKYLQFFIFFIILVESSQCLVVYKLFSRVLLINTMDIFISWTTVFYISVLIAAAAGLRSKNTANTILYSAIQNSIFFLFTAIFGYNKLEALSVATVFLINYIIGMMSYIKSNSLYNAYLQIVTSVLSILSVGGIPPLVGFFAKAAITSESIRIKLLLLVLVIVISTLLSFIYYARVVIHDVQKVIEQKLSSNKKFKLSSLCLIVLIATLLFVNKTICYQLEVLSNLCRFVLSPTMESTDHRFGLVLSAISLLSIEAPNKHMFYSLGEVFWALLRMHYLSGGSEAGLAHWFHEPFDGPLLPKMDSRYFWLSEILSYPWQYVPTISGSVAGTSREIFRARGDEFEAFLLRWLLDSYATFEYANTRWLLRLVLKLFGRQNIVLDTPLERLEPIYLGGDKYSILYGEAESFDKHVAGSLQPIKF